MIRAVLVLLWGLLVAIALRALLGSARRSGKRARRAPDELVKDPVCQTYIVRSRAIARAENGVLLHFCSPECARQFAHSGSRSSG